MGQLAIVVSRLEAQARVKLLSQPEVDLQNVSVITIKSGKQLEGPKKSNSAPKIKQ